MPAFRTTISLPNFRLGEILGQLLQDAELAERDRRYHGRMPFFQPARAELEGREKTISVFTRDITREGMGLLHNFPIEPQTVNLAVTCSDGSVVSFELHLDWCLSCGQGWYISGGGFVADSGSADS